MDNQDFYAFFSEYEKVRGRLFCRLMNTGRNREYLEDMPSRRWMDLSICCYCDITEDEWMPSFVLIRNSCLSLWNVSGEDLLEEAWGNTVRKEPFFEHMTSVLDGLGPGSFGCPEHREPAGPPLYVLTDPKRIYGAVFMTVPGVLEKIGDQLEEDFFIIPSSIHECLILPDRDPYREEELNELVCQVNRTEVESCEVLADHVYRYERKTERIRMSTACGDHLHA